jgi:hypothetical protein
VTFAQRFGSALNCNPHFHSLLLDGVFNVKTGVFQPAPSLKDEDVKKIVETTAHRVIRMLERRGMLEQNEYDEFAEEQPVLAGITSASIVGLVSVGERAGQQVRRVLQDPAEGIRTGDLCYASRGLTANDDWTNSSTRPEKYSPLDFSDNEFSLHAATRIAAGNKDGMERLCSYVARPPLAAGSLQRISDEEYSFKLKTPWSDGTTHLIFSPEELIEKLAALVPPPR